MSKKGKKSKENDDLKVLMNSEIINPNITLGELLETTRKLESSELDVDFISAWSFIVKGKFIFKDDEKGEVKEEES